MDLYGDDRNLSELNEELNEFLDHDTFTPTSSDSGCGLDVYPPTGMDEDWLDSFFTEDPVLNDRMISDALQPPAIRHEHSYSLANNITDANNPDSPLTLIKPEPTDQEMDTEMMPQNSPMNLTFTPALTLKTHKQTTLKHDSCSNQAVIKTTHGIPSSDTHINSTDCGSTTTHHITTTTTAGHQQHGHNSTTPTATLVKQPTIILATTQSSLSAQHHSSSSSATGSGGTKLERLVLPKVNIKVEPEEAQSPEHMSSYLDLPPTPPSSTNSDSDGGNSPQRSAPSSPVRQGSLRHTIRTSQTTTSLFSSPISQSGMLMLSEEERRTLISEGYPIPNKLPLTKQEEKNLKKVRRKIKNKISAQESRRKKKEYLETLEKKVEVYNQENVDLKKKMESLENNNRTLLSQLQKLQSIVNKVTKGANSTQNTCLMVFVLCFAVFLGSWSPANFSIGNSRAVGAPSAVKVPMGPVPKGVQVNAYTTPNMRSRVLLSMKEEPDEDQSYGPATPLFSYKEMLVSFFHGSGGLLAPPQEESIPVAPVSHHHEPLDPEMPQVHITDAQSVPDAHLMNETGDQKRPIATIPQPDMTANVPTIDNSL